MSNVPTILKTGFRPRKHQRYLGNMLRRFNVLVCHRRFGKTVFAINTIINKILIKKSLGNYPRPRGYYVAPLFRQAKTVAWDYLLEFTRNFPDVKANQSELKVDFLGDCRIQLLGADNPDTHRGIYADEAVLDEYGQMNPKMWGEVLRPALADRKGGAIFIGTPMGRNAFYKMYKRAKEMGKQHDWYSCMYKASKTGIVDADELVMAKMEMTEEEYQQEFECSWTAAILGAYYGRIMNTLDTLDRISDKVIYEHGLPVHTAWDLGMDDQTVIWFYQQHRQEVRVIDYYAGSGEGLGHYTRVVANKPYTYGDHYLPHDATVRELGSGKSRLETFHTLGLNGRVVRRHSKEDGIETVRKILPNCWFNETNCSDGIEALRQYRKEYNVKDETFKVQPLHDWASHPADAFRTLAMGIELMQERGGGRQVRTLSEWDEHDQRAGSNFDRQSMVYSE